MYFPKFFPVKLKAKNTYEIYRLSVKRTSRSPSFWQIALDRYAHEFASPKTNQEIKFFKKPGKIIAKTMSFISSKIHPTTWKSAHEFAQ